MTRIRLDPDQTRAQLEQRHHSLQQGLHQALARSATHLPSPHRVLLRSGSLRLLAFEPTRQARLRTPLLICYALVNRPWILDLTPQRSLIRALLDQGLPVYLIDWGYPARCDRHLTLEDYLGDLLDRCVERVCADSGVDRVNLLGVCQGGVLALCYSLLFAPRVRNLITLVTPVDCAAPDFPLNRLTRGIDIELAVDTCGNLPGPLLNEVFTALQPMRLGLEKRLAAREQLNGDEAAVQHYLLMEQWLQDCPDLAGAALKEFVQLFFRDNALMDPAGFRIGDHRLNLADLHAPVLNIYGNRDQLVPPAASAALARRLPDHDYTEQPVAAGHIGVLNGSRALARLPGLIRRWLQARESGRD